MLTQDQLKELLSYDHDTGEFIVKSRALKWFADKRSQESFNSRFAGKVAGTTNNTKSVAHLMLLGVKYKTSDLYWLYVNGKFKSKSRVTAQPKERATPYGNTQEERRIFLKAFSKVAGKMSVEDVAQKMNITETQVRKFAQGSGWSIKHVSNK
tara:strand:- start:292 stop:750 length:459 start_codon:yes stop_codon:yes gene_type:complete